MKWFHKIKTFSSRLHYSRKTKTADSNDRPHHSVSTKSLVSVLHDGLEEDKEKLQQCDLSQSSCHIKIVRHEVSYLVSCADNTRQQRREELPPRRNAIISYNAVPF